MEHPYQLSFYGYQLQGVSGSTTQGVVTGTHKAFGAGSGQIDKDSNNIKTRLIGNIDVAKIKGGGAVTKGTFNFEQIFEAAPLLLANLISGSLDFFTVSGGHIDGTTIGWHAADCRVNSLSLRMTGGANVGVLGGSLSFIGGQTVENAAAETVSAPVGNPMTTYDALVTRGASTAFEINGFDLNLAYTLEPRFVLSGAARTSGKVRLWDYLRVAGRTVSGSITLLDPFASDVLADTVTSQNLTIRLVDTVAGGIINLAVTGFVPDSQTFHIPNQGFETYTVPFTATGMAITAV